MKRILMLCLCALTAEAVPNPNQAVDPDLELSLLASDIKEGMEMTIASDGRVFIAERLGKVKLFYPDKPRAID